MPAPTSPAPLPVGRLAPSPTGLLHLGHARTFLLAWWHLRSRGGRVWLRLEDLDRSRVKPGLAETCLRDLEWLGLDWDGEPWVQSVDTSAYTRALEKLQAEQRVYPCACSRRDIARALSAPHASDGEVRYPGTCRNREPDRSEAEQPLALRFRVPEGELALEDGCVGTFRSDVQREVGDFLLARRDGYFAYQLAVVVDDARMGVNEVLRGLDLLPSTGRQWHLQRALGLASPRWFHVPLVLDEGGERLAKRRGDLALATLREQGTDPRAVVAWAARSAGQAASDERPRASEILPGFELGRLPEQPVRLDAAMLERLRAAR